jgi:hypothetical protein
MGTNTVSSDPIPGVNSTESLIILTNFVLERELHVPMKFTIIQYYEVK